VKAALPILISLCLLCSSCSEPSSPPSPGDEMFFSDTGVLSFGDDLWLKSSGSVQRNSGTITTTVPFEGPFTKENLEKMAKHRFEKGTLIYSAWRIDQARLFGIMFNQGKWVFAHGETRLNLEVGHAYLIRVEGQKVEYLVTPLK